MQNIKDDRLPLEQYLLHCDTNVALPAYFEEKSLIDFGPILVKNRDTVGSTIVDVKDQSTWPDAEQLGLDESQHRALHLALTKAVALIQGKPSPLTRHQLAMSKNEASSLIVL